MLKNKIKAFSVLAFVLAISLSLLGLSLDKPSGFVFAAEAETPLSEESTTENTTEANAVAKIGETAYKTLAEAVAAATAGDTVTLVADTAENVVVDKDLTIDLGDYTISNDCKVANSAVVTVNSGNLVLNANKGGIYGGEGSSYKALIVNNAATVTINGGNYTVGGDGSGSSYGEGNETIAIYGSGDIVINGGTFSSEKDWNIFYYVLNVKNGKTGTFVVKGGTFIKYNPAVGDDNMHGNFVPEGYRSVDNGDGSYTVKKLVAKIGDVEYTSLSEAVAAAKAGDTVVLISNIELDEQVATGKAITIDGQGAYTIKATKKLVGEYIISGKQQDKAGMFYRTQGAQGTLTFKNVTLDGNRVSKIFLNEGGAGETVFDGVTSINGGGIAYGSGIHISGGGSHATIKNSTLTGSTGTMILSAANYYAANDLWVGGNVYVTVENSTIGYVFVNSAPSATATNGVVHGQLTITGKNTKITYLSGEEEAADKLDKYGNNGSLVKIENGSIDEIFDKGSFAISGGTFKTELKQEWLAKGFKAVANNDGTYGVIEYSTLKEYLVNLGTSITLKIGVNEVGENVKVTYAYNGGEEAEIKKHADGFYYIENITPQIIDRVYTVKVYEGETVVDSKELSVLGYCDTLLGTTTATEKAKTAVKALVYYGKAAKQFLGMTDTTAIEEVIKNHSLTETELAKPTSGATSTGENLISKVTLNVSDVNAIVYAMTAENYATVYGENSGYTVTIGGKEVVGSEWVASGDLYVYTGAGIYASELGKQVEVVIKKTIDDNTETAQTLVYGVYDYCANKWETDGVSGIAKAIYAYGVACAAYVA